MGVYGESQIRLGHVGLDAGVPPHIGVQHHARRPNLIVNPREAAYYAVALLALGGGLGLDHLNTSRAREAVAAAEAATAIAEAEQEAAEQKVADDVRNGRAIDFETGIFGIADGSGGRWCLLNPIVSGRYLLVVGRADENDPSSLQVLAVGVVEQTDPEEPHDIATTTLGWDPDRGVYRAMGSAYQELAVGAGMRGDSSQEC